VWWRWGRRCASSCTLAGADAFALSDAIANAHANAHANSNSNSNSNAESDTDSNAIAATGRESAPCRGVVERQHVRGV